MFGKYMKVIVNAPEIKPDLSTPLFWKDVDNNVVTTENRGIHWLAGFAIQKSNTGNDHWWMQI